MDGLTISMLALPTILFISMLVSRNMKYDNSYWFFELFHFLGGFFLAMFFSNFLDLGVWVLYAVIAAGIFWEILEFIVFLSSRLKTLLRQNQLTLRDTFLDLFLDAFGGAIFVLVFMQK